MQRVYLFRRKCFLLENRTAQHVDTKFIHNVLEVFEFIPSLNFWLFDR